MKVFPGIMKWTAVFFLFTGLQSSAQDDVSKISGKLSHDSRPQAGAPRIKNVFQTFEKLPFISSPKGMNIQENYISYDKEGNNGTLYFSLYLFYRDNQGNIKVITEEVPTISVVLNKPEELMDANSIFYNGEDFGKDLPMMFTDTFNVVYHDVNGERVGETIDTRFKHKKFILNPRQKALFRPVTQEEYLKYFIGSLQKQVTEDSLHQLELKTEMESIRNDPSLKKTLEDMENINRSMRKYFQLVKMKKQLYEKKLALMSAADKKAPAYLCGHKDLALPMKDGQPVEEISGHLEKEPADENEELVFKVPVFTFSEKFWDKKYSKGALQLLVITSPFWEGDVSSVDNPLKIQMEKEVFPLISYKEIVANMYQ